MIASDIDPALILKKRPIESDDKHRQPSNFGQMSWVAGWNTAIIIINTALKNSKETKQSSVTGASEKHEDKNK